MEERSFSNYWFERYLAEETLMGARCTTCHSLYVPPRPLCTGCQGSNFKWEKMQGTGKLAAFTCIAIGPPSMAEEGYDRDHPYCCGVVELDEKTRVVARIEGVDAAAPQTIHIGMTLYASFLHRDTGGNRSTILAFRPG